MAKATKKAAGKKASGKRTTIAPRGDKRFVRRDEKGRITESDDAGRSLSQDRKRTAKNEAKPGYGDRGDRAAKKSSAKKGASKKAAGKKSASKKGK
jgi:hypothetical protein